MRDVPVLLGESPALVSLRAETASAAKSQAKVLILGETGVGKEIVARLIHEGSIRRGNPFVAVNCSGIPETLLESELFGHVRGSFTGAYRDKRGLVLQAHGGTLFLDELGEMSLRMQASLLRFAETGEIHQIGADAPVGRTDVRIIAATNRDLRQRIAEGAFREDLYYRLNVVTIEIPPLRHRGADVLLLIQHYLERAAITHGLRTPTLSHEAAELLTVYAWPGNVRELKNMSERLVLQDRQRPVMPDDLPSEVRRAATKPLPVAPATRIPQETSNQETSAAAVDEVWARIHAGADFWVVVAQAFKAHELSRSDLAAVVDRGLRESAGSYRELLKILRLPPTDYKRLHSFLYQQKCNLPVASYRHGHSKHGITKVCA